eukprot:scaffold153072_cov50-Attheya_sp.AAC.1
MCRLILNGPACTLDLPGAVYWICAGFSTQIYVESVLYNRKQFSGGPANSRLPEFLLTTRYVQSFYDAAT